MHGNIGPALLAFGMGLAIVAFAASMVMNRPRK